jgi:hypothetical protein
MNWATGQAVYDSTGKGRTQQLKQVAQHALSPILLSSCKIDPWSW